MLLPVCHAWHPFWLGDWSLEVEWCLTINAFLWSFIPARMGILSYIWELKRLVWANLSQVGTAVWWRLHILFCYPRGCCVCEPNDQPPVVALGHRRMNPYLYSYDTQFSQWIYLGQQSTPTPPKTPTPLFLGTTRVMDRWHKLVKVGPGFTFGWLSTWEPETSWASQSIIDYPIYHLNSGGWEWTQLTSVRREDLAIRWLVVGVILTNGQSRVMMFL